jgi:hypothetical protein
MIPGVARQLQACFHGRMEEWKIDPQGTRNCKEAFARHAGTGPHGHLFGGRRHGCRRNRWRHGRHGVRRSLDLNWSLQPVGSLGCACGRRHFWVGCSNVPPYLTRGNNHETILTHPQLRQLATLYPSMLRSSQSESVYLLIKLHCTFIFLSRPRAP